MKTKRERVWCNHIKRKPFQGQWLLQRRLIVGRDWNLCPICGANRPVNYNCGQPWLAIFCVRGATDYSLHGSYEEAEAKMRNGEDAGECYGVAAYHIPTETLHMRDPLDKSDPEKVRVVIEKWLASGELENQNGKTS